MRKIFYFIWHHSHQVRVITDPVQDEEGWSYQVKMESKSWYLFNILIYKKPYSNDDFQKDIKADKIPGKIHSLVL